MNVAERLKKKSAEIVKSGPVWQGPEGEGPQGGVTQSQIAKWLGCRERFRVRMIEGWRGRDQFQKAIEYGNMWHVCEEQIATVSEAEKGGVGKPSYVVTWEQALKDYCKGLCVKYPTQVDEIDHWYRTCKTQFPHYVAYWAKHRDVEQRTPLMQEQVFDVPYELPSGRVVRLRGKFDSVDLIGKGKNAGIFLMENKTKGDVDRADLEKQLQWDLQTMVYLIALTSELECIGDVRSCMFGTGPGPAKVLGVRYNVIRRPFSGGKGGIQRKMVNKTNKVEETKDAFYKRLADDYFKPEPEYWFQRWKSEVYPADVKRFRDECLDPILEAMCWWYDWQVTGAPSNPTFYDPSSFHWRHPYGVMNRIDEGYGSDVDGYITDGSTVGLVKVTNLFPELQE
jgi:hypothetical protein